MRKFEGLKPGTTVELAGEWLDYVEDGKIRRYGDVLVKVVYEVESGYYVYPPIEGKGRYVPYEWIKGVVG